MIQKIKIIFVLTSLILILPFGLNAQEVIPLKNTHGLYNAYVIPIREQSRIDIQLVILSGSYDENEISGIAHYTEHLLYLGPGETRSLKCSQVLYLDNLYSLFTQYNVHHSTIQFPTSSGSASSD